MIAFSLNRGEVDVEERSNCFKAIFVSKRGWLLTQPGQGP